MEDQNSVVVFGLNRLAKLTDLGNEGLMLEQKNEKELIVVVVVENEPFYLITVGRVNGNNEILFVQLPGGVRNFVWGTLFVVID